MNGTRGAAAFATEIPFIVWPLYRQAVDVKVTDVSKIALPDARGVMGPWTCKSQRSCEASIAVDVERTCPVARFRNHLAASHPDNIRKFCRDLVRRIVVPAEGSAVTRDRPCDLVLRGDGPPALMGALAALTFLVTLVRGSPC